MKSKNNFMQAAHELFGVGEGGAPEKPQTEKKEAPVMEKFPPLSPVPTVEKQPSRESSEVFVLAKGLIITGQVTASGNVEVCGILNGDLEATGDIKVSGDITGNVKGRTISLNAAKVKGNILAEQKIVLDEKSVLIGDLSASSLLIAGNAKGNIKARGTVEFEKTAVLLGDIECTGISIQEGAEVCGKITMQSRRTSKIAAKE